MFVTAWSDLIMAYDISMNSLALYIISMSCIRLSSTDILPSMGISNKGKERSCIPPVSGLH